MEWQPVIGLEVHAQLATQSKIFSGAATAYGAAPNVQACGVDLGLPGVLPVLNAQAVELAVRFGLAIDAEIAPCSVFARKNYFYPDLPKGYQISQYEHPIVGCGHLRITLDERELDIGITRAHLEEDAGKSVHGVVSGRTGIDLNRAGTPLLEIVSEPVMHSAREAVAYMRELHRLVRHLGICDGNMQEGSFRCDANVSLRPAGSDTLGTRTEIKNLNSFRFVERAIEFEIERQRDILEDGGKVVQETRLYDPDKDETRTMRTKEDAHDYRYFPDPDLLPVSVSADDLARIRATLPELPAARIARYVDDYGLGREDAALLVNEPAVAAFFEASLGPLEVPAKAVANWITGEVFGALNRAGLAVDDIPITPAMLNQLVARIGDGTVSGKGAKTVFQAMWSEGGLPDDIIEAQGLKQVSDSGAIDAIVDEVIAANPAQVQDYLAGKEKILGYLVGQAMKASKGKANPAAVSALLVDKLKGD
ncbi:MAG: Asp-tRNA(Asn)/Glu-tRNA(Gln) amidotransferase subunit GatB [Gammaproteobacteria bacterium]|nr:Asp-tRNA(Asn)/Glu-tRNA(Gln) amidotransferase subunit GatB [Gammaproteobacteria bacterium]